MKVESTDPQINTIKIPSGQSQPAAGISLGNRSLRAIQMPSAWDAAALTLLGSLDGVSWQPLYDSSGNEVSYSVSAGRFIRLDLADLVGLPYLMVRSGTSGTPVAQTADRILQYLTI